MSTTVGAAAISGRCGHQPQGRLPGTGVQGGFVNQRPSPPRPRVQGSVSRAARSNERWAMDVTPIDCGEDGWAHLAAVIDCHDREVIGYELALRARANEAERALES